jgi:hypothetical protein
MDITEAEELVYELGRGCEDCYNQDYEDEEPDEDVIAVGLWFQHCRFDLPGGESSNSIVDFACRECLAEAKVSKELGTVLFPLYAKKRL